MGTPNESNWPGVTLLPGYTEFETRDPLDLRPLFSHGITEDGRAQSANNAMTPDLSLFLDLLALDPLKRPSATKVGTARDF
jgi:hypothetical protein